MITTLTVSAVAIAFAVNILTSVLKRWVYPTFGKLGVQVVCFVLAAIGAWIWIYGQHIPSFWNFVQAALGLFSLAVAMYEVIFQRISWFKVETPEVQDARADARA